VHLDTFGALLLFLSSATLTALTCSVISRTFIGGNLAKGACPFASSSMVIPNDQMSAALLYL
jgi:hypothetical protein